MNPLRNSIAARSSSAQPPPPAAGSRSASSFRWPAPGGPRPGRFARDQRLGGDPARRHRRHPHRPLGNGAGDLDGSGPARGRGTRVRLVEGDDGISHARPERRAQARVGRLLHRRQPRHPQLASLRAPGRRHRAAPCCCRRRPTNGRCRSANDASPTASSRTPPRGAQTTYGKVAEAAAKLEPPKEVPLKDPKDWKIAGKPLKRLDTADKVDRQAGLRRRSQAAGHAERRHQGLPRLRRQGEELRCRQGHGACRASRRSCRSATPPWRWWPTPSGRPRRRSMRCRSCGTRATTKRSRARPSPQWLKEGLDAPEAFVGNENGDAKAAIASAAKKVEAVYSYPFQNHAPMEPMNATALYTPDKCEVWCPTQNGEAAFAVAVAASGLPADKVRCLQDQPRRRLWPARRLPRLRPPGRADRQANAGHARQAVVDARRGHAARPLPSGHAGQARRCLRCQQQSDRHPHAPVGTVDPRQRVPAEPAERQGSPHLPGPAAGQC